MKTLDEIKTEWAKDHSYENYFEFLDLTRKCDTDHVFIMDGAVTQIAKRYAKEVAKQALKNASASLIKHYFIDNSDKAIDSKEIEKIINCENNIPEI